MSYTALEAAKIINQRRKLEGKNVSPAALNSVAMHSEYTILIPLQQQRALAYNTVSQAFAIFDSDDLELWEEIRIGKWLLGEPPVNGFLKSGFIVENDLDEISEIRKEYDFFRFNERNMILTIAPTLSCNFSCSYCFQGLDKPVTKMKTEVKEAIIQMFKKKIYETDGIFVTWYGGEPLMDKKTIYELSERFIRISEEHQKPYSAFMVSNGYFLDVPTAEKLIGAKVTSVQITIDGDENTHDARRHLTSGRPTYARIMKNLESVTKETKLKVVVRVNIDTKNVQKVESLLHDFNNRGLSRKTNLSVYFAPVEAITDECASCSDDELKKASYSALEVQLIALAESLNLATFSRPGKYMGACAAVRPNGMVVVPNGDIHKCWDAVMNRNLRVGTVFDYKEIKTNKTHMKWMEWSPFDNATCSSCRILPMCAGACAFKFIHSDRTNGEGGALPCPSWKFNFSERMFARAMKLGLVNDADWDPIHSPTNSMNGSKTGQSHTYDTIKVASEKFLSAVSKP